MTGAFGNVVWGDIAIATRDTLAMLGASLALTVLFGIPLGVLLFLTGDGQVAASRPLTPYDSTNYSPAGRVLSVRLAKRW